MKAWLRIPWVGMLAALAAGGWSSTYARDNLKLVALSEPVMRFPQKTQNDGIYSGDVRLVVSIKEDGRIGDWLMVGYTHDGLAAVVREALPKYRFQPILRDGKPTVVRVGLTFNFTVSGLVISQTPLDTLQARFRATQKGPYTSHLVQAASELDSPVALRRSVQPMNVRDGGHVILDFYIDESGRVRMPAIKSTDRPDLAEAAAEALLQWEFAPPRRGGQPAIVRASQQFYFPENAEAARG
jgi:TonB family protein